MRTAAETSARSWCHVVAILRWWERAGKDNWDGAGRESGLLPGEGARGMLGTTEQMYHTSRYGDVAE